MAKTVMLRHKDTGFVKTGLFGYSWTTFFFGAFPALFRQDFITFLGTFAVIVVVGIITYGIGAWVAMFVWAFMYNGYYTRRLIERGYVFDDDPGRVAEACLALRIKQPASALSGKAA